MFFLLLKAMSLIKPVIYKSSGWFRQLEYSQKRSNFTGDKEVILVDRGLLDFVSEVEDIVDCVLIAVSIKTQTRLRAARFWQDSWEAQDSWSPAKNLTKIPSGSGIPSTQRLGGNPSRILPRSCGCGFFKRADCPDNC